jgi:segregation and condensation protein B
MSSKLKPKPEIPEDPRQAPDLLIEAALFSAGEPVSVDELVQKTQLSAEQVQDCLEDLQERYEGRRTSFHVVRSGDKWGMALREVFADESRDLVPPEIPLHVLRTLALIAYHQPMLQSDLQDMVGSKVYAHVSKLVELGLISKEREGITYELTTTSAFPEYFGIPSDEHKRIRNYLAEKVDLLSDGGAPQTEEGDARDAPPVPGVDPD